MTFKLFLMLVIVPVSLTAMAIAQTADAPASSQPSTQPVPSVLKFTMPSLDGKDVDLSQYQGKVLLMVNTASKCGYTKQYAGLEALYEKYSDKGLVILGFPCNQFGGQEPGSSDEIAAFCKKNFGVSFPMFAKIEVNGDGAAPLYKLLTGKETDAARAGEVKWNFEKFLISRDGQIVKRFRSAVAPDADALVKAVEAELAK